MKNIVIMDSGLGGLSVLKSLYKKLPNYNYVYFADTINLPYGAKTKKELLNITIKNIEYLKQKYNPILIIFGCNTLGVTVFKDIQKIFTTIKFFALQPNISKALKMEYNHILLLATTQTINMVKKTQYYASNKNCILLCKMPLLATKVENYIQNPIKIVPYLKQRLQKHKHIDCIVLGCSHYYFVKKQLKQMFKPAKIIDGTISLSNQVKLYLKQQNILKSKSNNNGKIKLILTGNTKNKNAYKQIIKNIIEKQI